MKHSTLRLSPASDLQNKDLPHLRRISSSLLGTKQEATEAKFTVIGRKQPHRGGLKAALIQPSASLSALEAT